MSIIEKVLAELQAARDKYPEWPTDPLHALAILGEEFGELTQAMLQLVYEPNKTSPTHVEKEAIQTAAMALRLVMSLDRYDYSPSEQHNQSEEAASSEAETFLAADVKNPESTDACCGNCLYWYCVDGCQLTGRCFAGSALDLRCMSSDVCPRYAPKRIVLDRDAVERELG